MLRKFSSRTSGAGGGCACNGCTSFGLINESRFEGAYDCLSPLNIEACAVHSVIYHNQVRELDAHAVKRRFKRSV